MSPLPKSMSLDPDIDPACLWNTFDTSGDRSAREKIIDYYLPFARMLAANAYAKRTSEEMEFLDYFQYASIGLMEAADRFEHGRGIKFESYAGPRITGAIMDGLASASEKQEQVSLRRRMLAARIKSLKGAAAETGDPNEVFGRLAEIAVGLALGFTLDESGMFRVAEPGYADNTYKCVELKQLRHRIKALLASLPDNERRVVKYHYLQELAFEEIANILSITKGRVSQIHRKALDRLRNGIRREGRIDLSC